MKTFPTLSTSRITLRKIRLSDIPRLTEYVNHPSISDNILNFPHPYHEEDAIARMNFVLQGFKNGDRYVFAIALNENDGFIGEIGLHLEREHDRAEMGFWVGEPFWGKGIMSEAVETVLKFGFEDLALNKILATHFVKNMASGRVLARNGMVREGELKDQYKCKGEYRSVIQYRLTKEEYEAFRS